MLAAVAALGYSLIEEYRNPKISCALGSISGYYYTPVRPVFVGVMVAIGLALIAIKGRTPIEDMCLSLAGMMAPIVAFIPTSDDLHGVCRSQMLAVGHYQPDQGGGFIPASISNDLHALVFAGYAAIILMVIAILVSVLRTKSTTEYTKSFWYNLGGGFAFVVIGTILLHWGYGWVLDGHARAACAMFAFLAAAAGWNCWCGFRYGHTSPWFASIYGVVGAAMIASGVVFILARAHNRSSLGGHLVLAIEAVEITLFVIFWATQTIERWNETV
jgi:hypothetical protein